jgi:hypothetical protein
VTPPKWPKYVPLQDLKFSRVYCVLKAYLDESYNSATMCVGGWLCHEDVWTSIESAWRQRIDYERRISIKRGEVPISRYHATDCANLKREFKQWSVERQIRLTKRLLQILGDAKDGLIGITIGMSIAELQTAFRGLTPAEAKWAAYKHCMCQCFWHIADSMDEFFPDDRVSVIYDRTFEFNTAAQSAYNDMFEAKHYPNKRYFVTAASGGWEDFTALQPADLIAFEGFKLTKSHKAGHLDLRRSLQKIIGHQIAIKAAYWTAEGLAEASRHGLALSKQRAR